MLYKDLCGYEKVSVSRENNTQQPDNNMQMPNENIMIPEDNPQCPTDNWSNWNNNTRPSDKWPNWGNKCPDKNDKCTDNNSAKNELLNKIRETAFAIVDLNQFLDTHPNCKEALELFTSLAFTLESLKREYTSQYGPLKAVDSANDTPFEWVAEQYLWPWQRKKEE